ncbi:acyl-CoA dehydrogenase [Streptomyces sp. NPDC018026]|uniref:acyl-CoA dehydrogenase n=1 Tax=Streptomyces sp. NPDC018026 TaxID=3365031 RepID=UPI0037B16D81
MSDAPTVARRLTELGRPCPSAGWIAGTCATSKTMTALSHSASARREFFPDPDALVCSSGLPSAQGVREADGIRVTGRWDNVSGCESAQWANLAVTVDDAYQVAAVHLADLTVERSRHMAGMRGTGSQRLVADGLLLPVHRVAQGGPPAPPVQLFLGLCVLAPVVGAAQGALDVVQDMFESDRKPFKPNHTHLSDSPGERENLTEVEHAQLRTSLAVRPRTAGARWTPARPARLQRLP